MAEAADRIDTLDTHSRIDETMERWGAAVRHWLWLGAVALALLWAVGAVYYDGPLGKTSGNLWLTIAWMAAMAAGFFLVPRGWRRRLFLLIGFLVVLIPWLGKSASNDRDWYPEWAETASVTFEDGTATFHNFRNFDHRDDGSVEERWESRTVRLDNLRGVDYFHDNFGGDLLAHPILSFDFGPDGHIALSIETRREVGESFTKIGGLYKYFELQYVWGDEADMIRMRVLRDEPVHLYRLALKPAGAFFLLMDSVRTTNALAVRPRFYNVITANCTTSLFAQTPELKSRNFDMRMLLNGRLDELAYEDGFIETSGLDFETLRAAALVNEAARAVPEGVPFSSAIREGRPGVPASVARLAAD